MFYKKSKCIYLVKSLVWVNEESCVSDFSLIYEWLILRWEFEESVDWYG